MTTKQRTQRTQRQQRTATLATMTNGDALLLLAAGGVTTGYKLRPAASAFGRAFWLGKYSEDGDGEEYDVLLHGPETSCTCKGNTYRGKCKHVDALTKLIQLGKL
jgi:hypothetical protein